MERDERKQAANDNEVQEHFDDVKEQADMADFQRYRTLFHPYSTNSRQLKAFFFERERERDGRRGLKAL